MRGRRRGLRNTTLRSDMRCYCSGCLIMAKTREDHMGIRQMTTLLRAGYPLSDALRLAIAELVSAAAQAARRTRDPKEKSR